MLSRISILFSLLLLFVTSTFALGSTSSSRGKVTIISDGKTSEFSSVCLIQVVRGQIKAQNKNRFSLTDPIYNRATLNIFIKGASQEISLTSGEIEHGDVPVEVTEWPLQGDLQRRLEHEWAGVTRFRYEDGDLMGEISLKRFTSYDVTTGVWILDIRDYGPVRTRWIIQFSGLTPKMIDAALKEKVSNLTDIQERLSDWGTDVLLPLYGAKVEILHAEGDNIFPQLWKAKKVPVIWCCSRAQIIQ